jgi:Flp pilus assembly protein TadD
MIHSLSSPLPLDAVAYNNRGYAYKDNGDLDRAIKDYLKALELNQLKPNQNDDAGVYNNNLGEAYELKGDLDKAFAAYETALSLDPDNTATRQNLERARKGDSHHFCALP